MHRSKILVLFFIFLTFINTARAQEDISVLTEKFSQLYKSGNFIDAEKCLLKILERQNTLPAGYKTYINTNLGVICTHLGRYDDALNYYNLAEKSLSSKVDSDFYLTEIYLNKAIIYGYQKDYQVSLSYYEKGIRNYIRIKNPDIRTRYNLSNAYLDLGILLLGIGDTDASLSNLEISREMKKRFGLEGIEYADLNIARIYAKLSEPARASVFFRESIASLKQVHGNDYYRLPEIYFEFGQFLNSSGEYNKALNMLNEANRICLKSYGEKHSLTSYSYKLLGDFYFSRGNYYSALEYYQKSLISIVSDFNDHNIFSNPSIRHSIYDVRLLDNLKSKSKALEMKASGEPDIKTKTKLLSTGLNLIDTAVILINKMRGKYISNESKMYLSGNEKETYLAGTRIAAKLLSATDDSSMIMKMYSMALESKAFGLRSEIFENNVLWSTIIPDSLREEQTRMAATIGAYENLIYEESLKESPDSGRINMWKDAIFKMTQDYEMITERISNKYPEYSELLKKTKPVTISEIQRHLKKGITVIDYFLCNSSDYDSKRLYIFLITKEKIMYFETRPNSLFTEKAKLIYKTSSSSSGPFTWSEEYADALFYMYKTLIKPVENKLTGDELIIIPDEEIALLPFDAFLTEKTDLNGADFENLPYLIYRYTVSYAYSSSLIFSDNLARSRKVAAFVPDYKYYGNKGSDFNSLRGASKETESVLRLFRGKCFSGKEATRSNFLSILPEGTLIHLAMHSVADTLNSQFSYLMFSTDNLQEKDSRLYNYEISISRVKSPMVVLSSCNSGAGKLFRGEGLISFARGFMLAGASSVIRTSWAVNDETSAAIITRFYFHLSRGKSKNHAMRLAKLDYLKKSTPAYSSPYYWAAYEVLGDISPVVGNRSLKISSYVMLLILITCAIAFYFRRRRIFNAR